MATYAAGHKTTYTDAAQAAHYRDNVYFQDGLWMTGILAALLFLIVAASLDSAKHVQSMALLIPVAVGAFTVSVLMAYSRFDGFFALAHSMFTGLAWILFLMANTVQEKEITSFLDFGIPPLQSRVYFVLWRLLNWVDAALSSQASKDNYVFIFEICFLVWWLTYLGAWSIFRYGYTWRAIIPAGVVLLINTYYAPRSTVGFLAVFALLTLVLLVRTNLAEQQLRWRERRIYFSQDITWDFLRNGFLYSVIVLALAAIAPGLGRNPLVRNLLTPINEQWEQTNEQLSTLYGGLNRQKSAQAPAFGNSLSLGGKRNVGDSLVFNAAAARARYWRAVVFDTYDGKAWKNTTTDQIRVEANDRTTSSNWQMRDLVTQTITLMQPVGNVIFSAPEIRQIDVPITTLVRLTSGGGLPADAAGTLPPLEHTYVRSRNDLEVNDRYTVISQYSVVTQQALEAASTDYPPELLERYLQLPENFSVQVAELARTVTADKSSVYTKTKAIESYLRTFTYNEQIEAPPEDRDPVEYFLFDIKEGYCDYYATAMALMLRSLGIPARTASGYAEGLFDEETGLYYISERDAHTWVEVFFPEYGWIEFEPTAGESPLDRPREDDLNEPAFPNSQTDQNNGANGPENPLQDQQIPDLNNPPEGVGEGGSSSGGTWPWWVWALLTPLLLVGGFLGLRRMQAFAPTAFTPELPPILFDRMWRWAERLGFHPRANHTPYEQARHFSRILPDGQPAIQTITESYVQYRFAAQVVEQPARGEQATQGTGQGAAIVAAWQRLQTVMLKAWGKKLLRVILRKKESPFKLQIKN